MAKYIYNSDINGWILNPTIEKARTKGSKDIVKRRKRNGVNYDKPYLDAGYKQKDLDKMKKKYFANIGRKKKKST